MGPFTELQEMQMIKFVKDKLTSCLVGLWQGELSGVPHHEESCTQGSKVFQCQPNSCPVHCMQSRPMTELAPHHIPWPGYQQIWRTYIHAPTPYIYNHYSCTNEDHMHAIQFLFPGKKVTTLFRIPYIKLQDKWDNKYTLTCTLQCTYKHQCTCPDN